MSNFVNRVVAGLESSKAKDAVKELLSLADADNYVGELLSLNYDKAVVLVHDNLRQKVRGLPMGCFLLATRVDIQSPPPAGKEDALAADEEEDILTADKEDTALLLLRVVSDSQLPNHAETSMQRMEAGFRSSDTPKHWDSDKKTDQFTLNRLRHAGVQCDVLGTFRMKEVNSSWNLSFGADISNFYSGQGMKVYKPMGESLRRIVNYTKPTGKPHDLAGDVVDIGRVRYCASEIAVDASREHVAVDMEPTDLLARRTALFGMSRSGKSNTIKIIASSIFNLRKKDEKKGRIGQLIFDVNGEYCNDNPQDKGCLRGIWEATGASQDDVSTYGLFEHPNDKKRNLLKLNFHGNDPQKWEDRSSVESAMELLVAGKEIIDEMLSGETSGYIGNFRNTSLAVPDNDWGCGDITRYRRVVQIYRSFLVSAGFEPRDDTAYIHGLFSKQPGEFLQHMGKEYPASAKNLGKERLQWDVFQSALGDVQKFISDKKGGFTSFDSDYQNKKEKSWADNTLRGILSLLENSRGLRVIKGAKEQHSSGEESDYADDIVRDVRQGKLVIVDQSTGSPEQIMNATKRVMWKLFNAQKSSFIDPRIENEEIVPPPDVVVYAEEAHNLLPAKPTPEELKSVWARTAKEGSKFHIGMVYSTQEPSSILPNILKNTDNWFVAHLNNQDEIKELKKYYDFAAFAQQILKVPETGFLRMRCLSNPYIVPVQVREFTVAPKGE